MNASNPDWFTRPLHAWHRYRAETALRRRFPALSNALAPSVASLLAGEHAIYVEQVSTAQMAASLETTQLLWRLCDVLQPKRLLDTGSGFSSFVLRSWAADQGAAEVWSVDDDEQWLGRTIEFLRKHNLNCDHIMAWPQFAAAGQGEFDLVFHDLGSMTTRARTLSDVLSRTRERVGVLVLDDTHKPPYEQQVHEELNRWQCTVYDARRWTHDAFGRRATVVCDLRQPAALAAA